MAAGGRPRLPRLKAGEFFPGDTRTIRALAEGWIRHDRASEIYRAAIRGDGTIDHQATGRLRAD